MRSQIHQGHGAGMRSRPGSPDPNRKGEVEPSGEKDPSVEAPVTPEGRWSVCSIPVCTSVKWTVQCGRQALPESRQPRCHSKPTRSPGQDADNVVGDRIPDLFCVRSDGGDGQDEASIDHVTRGKPGGIVRQGDR